MDLKQEHEWVRAHGVHSVVMCRLPPSLLTESTASCQETEEMPHAAAGHYQWQIVTCQGHLNDRMGMALLLGTAHKVTYPSVVPVPPSRCWYPDVGPVGDRRPAGQQPSLHSVERPCAVTPAR